MSLASPQLKWNYRSYQEALSSLPLKSDIDWSSWLQHCSVGWKARYEVWSICDSPSRVRDIEISLEDDEVWLQMQQSLIWKAGPLLQFPLAISFDLKHFTILRTIFVLSGLSADETTPPRTLRIDLAFSHSIIACWMQDLYNQCLTGRWWFRQAGTYLYWMKLSGDGRYVFFMDTQPRKPINFAVFELSRGTEVSLRLLNGFSTERSLSVETRTMDNMSAVFHPEMPLLAFSFFKAVLLWPFCTCELRTAAQM
jgi:hypothetical protein